VDSVKLGIKRYSFQKWFCRSITAGECGADVNSRADDGGFTPLRQASENGALEVVRLLLEHGADVEAVNGDGETALQVVGKTRYREVNQGRRGGITKLLLEHGAMNTL
jgi:hypothetical protein